MSTKTSRGPLQKFGGVDPMFDPGNTPRLALLYQVCHTALWTITSLSTNETHRQKLGSEALRVGIWGIDLFDATQCASLDELLSFPSSSRSSMRRHLIGVWADIAATLDVILMHLVNIKNGEVNSESYAHRRRLRIALGLEDIASAVHDGFSYYESMDSNSSYDDSNEILTDAIDSLQSLIDCLFDLLVTVGTIRQLSKLGFKPNVTSSSIFEEKIEKIKNHIKIPPVPHSSAMTAISQADSSVSINPQRLEDLKSSFYGLSKNRDTHLDDSLCNDKLNEAQEIVVDAANVVSYNDRIDQSAKSVTASDIPSRSVNTITMSLSSSEGYRYNITGAGGHSSWDSSRSSSRNSSRNLSRNSSRNPPRDRSRDMSRHSSKISSKGSSMRGPPGDPPGDLSEDSSRKLRRASSKNIFQFHKPIRFSDGYGRTFAFSFDMCRTWEDMRGLIKEAFKDMIGTYANTIRTYIKDGKYDLVSSENEIILPSQWEKMVEPGMTVGFRHGFGFHPFPSNIAYDPGFPSIRSKGKKNQRSKNKDTEKKEDSLDEEATPTVSTFMGQSQGSFPATARTPLYGRYITQTSSLPMFDDLIVNNDAPYAPPPKYHYDTYRPPLPIAARPSQTLKSTPSFNNPVYESKAAEKRVQEENRAQVEKVSEPVDSTAEEWGPWIEETPKKPKKKATNTKKATSLMDENVQEENPMRAEKVSTPVDRTAEKLEPWPMKIPRAPKKPKKKATNTKEANALTGEIAQEENPMRAEKDSSPIDRAAKELWVQNELTTDEKETKNKNEAKTEVGNEVEHEIESDFIENEMVTEKVTTTKPEPIHFIDAIGRKFAFPYQHCSTWDDMMALVKQASLHVEDVGHEVEKGHYGLVDPTGNILLPSIWESSVQPGWKVTMQMWWPTLNLPSAQLSKAPEILKSSDDLTNSPAPPTLLTGSTTVEKTNNVTQIPGMSSSPPPSPLIRSDSSPAFDNVEEFAQPVT